MDHHVHRERQTGGPHGGGKFGLPGMRTGEAKSGRSRLVPLVASTFIEDS